MRTKFNRFAIFPFHCEYCHNYIWLEKYRKASVWNNIPTAPPARKVKVCKKCVNYLDIKE